MNHHTAYPPPYEKRKLDGSSINPKGFLLFDEEFIIIIKYGGDTRTQGFFTTRV